MPDEFDTKTPPPGLDWSIRAKLAEVEARVNMMSESIDEGGQALRSVEQLRVILIGEDGTGGAIAEIRRDHEREIEEVEAKATESARFVRRIMVAAIGLILSGAGVAGAMVYSAGESAADNRATIREIRLEHSLSIQRIEETLRQLRDDVRGGRGRQP